MPAPKIRANYTALQGIAQSFSREGQNVRQTLSQLQRQMEVLQGGSWVGKNADKFYGEMQSSVMPSVKRLGSALEEAGRVTQRISQLVKQAEDDAAAVLRGDGARGGGEAGAGAGAPGAGAPARPEGGGPGGGGPGGGGAAGSGGTGNIPPRVYVINGINNEGQGLPQMRDYLIQHGYDPSQVKVTPSVYDTNLQGYVKDLKGTDFKQWYLQPVNWLTGLGASVVKGGAALANTVVGAGQVAVEYVTGGASQTQRVDDFIRRDLEANPLLPGQGVVFIGHSGGGAIAANLAPKWEGAEVLRTDGTRSGLDVQGVVTMGSPVVNRDAAARVAKVVDIHDSGEIIGREYIRSEESRLPVGGFLAAPSPVWLGPLVASEVLARDSNNVVSYTTHSGANGALASHSSYWTTNEVWGILQNEFGF